METAHIADLEGEARSVIYEVNGTIMHQHYKALGFVLVAALAVWLV